MQKDSALLLVKSPNLYNEYTRHGAAHIRGLPIRVFIRAFGDAHEWHGWQPTFYIYKHCRITPIGCLRRTRKNRHYEQCNYVDKHSHAVLLCLLRIFACTEKKPHPVAMVLKLLAKWFYRTYSACLFTNFRV